MLGVLSAGRQGANFTLWAFSRIGVVAEHALNTSVVIKLSDKAEINF